MIIELNSSSPDITFDIGKKLGKNLKGNEIILVSGELGAGKTVLAKGIACSLGIDPDDVVSPTFTLMNQFAGRLFRLFHFDLYRLEGKITNNLCEIDDYIDIGVIVVEWAQFLDSSYSNLKQSINVRISVFDTKRVIKIETPLRYIIKNF